MTVRIRMRARGPFVIERDVAAPLEILRADGSLVDISDLERIRLCRCGASACKPICDGSHDRIGFEAPADEGEEGPG